MGLTNGLIIAINKLFWKEEI